MIVQINSELLRPSEAGKPFYKATCMSHGIASFSFLGFMMSFMPRNHFPEHISRVLSRMMHFNGKFHASDDKSKDEDGNDLEDMMSHLDNSINDYKFIIC